MPVLCEERRLSPPRPNQEHRLKLLELEPSGRPEPFERLALPHVTTRNRCCGRGDDIGGGSSALGWDRIWTGGGCRRKRGACPDPLTENSARPSSGCPLNLRQSTAARKAHFRPLFSFFSYHLSYVLPVDGWYHTFIGFKYGYRCLWMAPCPCTGGCVETSEMHVHAPSHSRLLITQVVLCITRSVCPLLT